MFAEQATDPTVSDVATIPAEGGSSGAAETPTADATEPAPSGETSESPAGPPRDEHGRFRPRDGTTDSAPGAPAGTATDDPLAPDANPDDPAAAPTATESAPEVSPPPAAPAGQPFAFLHRGQMHGVDGAVVTPDGALVVPAASRTRVEQMLARGRELEVVGPQLAQQHQREVASLRSQLEQRHAGVEAFGQLLADNPDAETFLGRALAFYEQLPALREQMTRAELEARDRRIAELEGRAPQGQPMAQGQQSTGPTPEDYAQAIRGQTGQMLLQARQALPAFQAFTDQELGQYLPLMVKRAGLYVRQATPDDAALYDVQPGEPVFDADAFTHELTLVAGETIRQKQAAAAKAKVQPAVTAAAQRNAAVLAPTKAPPVPKPGAGTAAPVEDKHYDSYEDWKQDFVYGRRRAG
jgi:hypothetical protein